MWSPCGVSLGSCRVAMLIFLGIYLLSGLQQLILAKYGSGDYPHVPWKYSILSLFGGVYFDNLHNYGSSFNVFMVVSCICILFIEDCALETGFIFGQYSFTDHFGYRITPRLPLLVIVLWQSLLFPAFSLSYFIINNFMQPKGGYGKQLVLQILQIILASLLITGFDIISEPIAVLYGHRLWHHAAYISNSCDSYTPQPDWVFSTFIDKMEDVIPSTHQQWNYYYYYGIPLQNFFGWFLTSMYIYILFTSFIFYFKLRHAAYDACSHISYLVPIVCTILFYILHPCHPLLVKRNGCIYLLGILLLLVSSMYYKQCNNVKSD